MLHKKPNFPTSSQHLAISCTNLMLKWCFSQKPTISLILELLHRRSGTGQTPWLSSVGIRYWPMYSMNHFPFQFFFGTESFPFQIFFGMESDSYITKCLISVQHSSSLISSIKKGNLLFLKEFHCQSRDLNPGSSALKVSA